MPSLSEQVQLDLYGRLLADPFFADVHLFLMRPRAQLGWTQIAELVDVALAGQKKKAGKAGVAVQVLMPVADVLDPNVPGPRRTLIAGVRIQEIPVINMGPHGTMKSAEEIAERVEQLGHHFQAGYGNVLTWADTAPNDEFDQRVTIDVSFRKPTGLCPYPKTAAVTLSPAPTPLTVPQTIALACATPGAAITYSLDGSYPALPYTEPLSITAPGTLRAAASAPGLQQSDVVSVPFRAA